MNHPASFKLCVYLKEYALYWQNYPNNNINNRRLFLRKGWLQKYMAYSNTRVFHFLQSMWRWLNCAKYCIDKNDRQHLMYCVRKLVYGETEIVLQDEYHKIKRGLKYSFCCTPAHLTHDSLLEGELIQTMLNLRYEFSLKSIQTGSSI